MNIKITECVAQGKSILAAHKKKICGAVVLCAVAGSVGAGTNAMFKVSGVVTSVEKNQLAVTDFFRTQTVDLTGAPVNADKVQVGDRVKIRKNLQGQVLSLHTARHDEDKRSRKPEKREDK